MSGNAILNDLSDYLVQPNSSPGLAYVGDFHQDFSDGLKIAILKPAGTGGPLQQAFQNCAPGELAFVVIDDGCNGPMDFTVTIDVPTHQFGNPAYQNPSFPVTPLGDLSYTADSPMPTTVNGVTTMFLTLNATSNATRSGAVILSYPVDPAASVDLTYTAASLEIRKFSSGCGEFDENAWGGLPDGQAMRVTKASAIFFDGELIRANRFGTGNDLVLVTGNPIYIDNFWPASQDAGVKFAMAPGSTISFGDANNVVAGLTVPNGQFFPCSNQRFNTVEIGPNSNVTFVDPGVSSSTQPTIFGAVTGVTVQNNAQFTMNNGTIRSSITGVSGDMARSVSLTNVGINQNPGSYPESNFRSPGTRGLEGINLQTTNFASPNPGQYTFTNVNIDNFDIGLASGKNSGLRGPFSVLLQNSSITNSRDGVLLRRGLNGRFELIGNNITVEELGVEFIWNFNSGLAAGNNIISAGLTGFEVVNRADNFFGAVSNVISGTDNSGIRIRSSGDLFNVNNNDITMPTSSDIGAFGVGIFSNTNGVGGISNNTITTGPNISNFGVITQSSNSLNAATNSILLSNSQSTGVVIADGDNVTTNCNQVTVAAGNRGSTTGMELSTNINSNHGCNFFNQTVNGLQILGGNTGATYTSNTFLGNDVGLLVGGLSNVSNNQSNVLIGGQQMDADNVWADIAQPNREARHLTNFNLRDFNSFFVRPAATYFPANGMNGPVVFQNIPSLEQWFDYSNPADNPAGCPAACSILPPGWPVVQPCLPDAVASQDSDYPTFQRQQARLNAKYASDFDQVPCDDNVLPCYQEIANLEQEFYDVFGSSLSEASYEAYRGLLASEEEQSGNGYSSEFLGNVMSLLDAEAPDDLSIAEDLGTLLTKIYAYDACEEVTALWQESLVFAVQQEMPDGLTEGQQVEFKAIANQCAGFDGPGVHIARASLGLAVSDGQNCGADVDSNPDSEQLVLRADKTDQVYPNPVKIGGMLTLQKPLTGWFAIYDALGQKVHAQYLEDSSSYSLSPELSSGMYIIRAVEGTYSAAFVISE